MSNTNFNCPPSFPYCPQAKCNIANGYRGSHKRWHVSTPSMYYIYSKELLNVSYNLWTDYDYTWSPTPGWPNIPTNCESLGQYQWTNVLAAAAVCYTTSPPISTSGTWGGLPPFGKDDNYTWPDIVGGSWTESPVWPPNSTDFFNQDGLRHGFANLGFSYNYRSEMLSTTPVSVGIFSWSSPAQDGQSQMDAAAANFTGPGTNPANDPDFKSEVMANVNIANLSATWQSGPINADTAQTVSDTYPVPYNAVPQGQHQFWRTKGNSSAMKFIFQMDTVLGPPSVCVPCCDFIGSSPMEAKEDLYAALEGI